MRIDDDIYALAVRLGEAALARKLRLATAESCTGGLVAGAITDVAGSSDWFDRGFVTYSNAAKIDQLGVPEALIARFGAVSGRSRWRWRRVHCGRAGPIGRWR